MTMINLYPGRQGADGRSCGLMPSDDSLETVEAETIVAMALDRYGSRLCVATSFTDTVLIDVVLTVDPDVPVYFCDTGFHFAETLATMKAAQARYGLDLRVIRPAVDAADVWTQGPDACCRARKVDGLFAAMAADGFEAWISGLRRADAPSRARTPIVAADGRGFTKINPLATWSAADVTQRVVERNLIVNPLTEQGYPSVGCWPCTDPVANQPAEGDGATRAGRWPDTAKTECGLHLTPAAGPDTRERTTEVSL